MKRKRLNVHLLWALGVVSLGLILSVSVQWSSVKELPNVISVALSLSSLLLALIAIFQSVSSETSLSGSLSAILEASRSAKDAAQQVASASENFRQRARVVETIPDALVDMREQLLAVLSANRSPFGREIQPSLLDDDRSLAQRTQSGLPSGGLIALYVCLLSSRTGKAFDPIEIESPESPEDFVSMVNGCIMVFFASGMLDITKDGNRYVTTDMRHFNEEEIDNDFHDLFKDNETWSKVKARIVDYFEG